MASTAKDVRIMKELSRLEHDPPPGISVWPKGQTSTSELEADITAPKETVYEGGIFRLEIEVPDRYPFHPPKVRFITPIYHPNIDSGGRICLDTLNLPPNKQGSWNPISNISSVLTTIRLLMAEPNPDDGLMAEITDQYRRDRAAFVATAREWTRRHAIRGKVEATTGGASAATTAKQVDVDENSDKVDSNVDEKKEMVAAVEEEQVVTEEEKEGEKEQAPERTNDEANEETTTTVTTTTAAASVSATEINSVDNNNNNNNNNNPPPKRSRMSLKKK